MVLFWAVAIGVLILVGVILAITFSKSSVPLLDRIFGG